MLIPAPVDHKTLRDFGAVSGGPANEYLRSRLDALKDMLVEASDDSEYRKIQGRCQELTEILTIIEDADALSDRAFERQNRKKGEMQKAF